MGACGLFQGSGGKLNLLRELVENLLQLSPSQPHLSWPSAILIVLFSLLTHVVFYSQVGVCFDNLNLKSSNFSF